MTWAANCSGSCCRRYSASPLAISANTGAECGSRPAVMSAANDLPSMVAGTGKPASSSRVGTRSTPPSGSRDALSGGDLHRPGDETRHPYRLLVHQALLHEAVVAEHLAVVAVDHEDGFLERAATLQALHQPADLAIDVGHQGVVVADHGAEVLDLESSRAAPGSGAGADRPVCPPAGHGSWPGRGAGRADSRPAAPAAGSWADGDP